MYYCNVNGYAHEVLVVCVRQRECVSPGRMRHDRGGGMCCHLRELMGSSNWNGVLLGSCVQRWRIKSKKNREKI